MYCSKCGSKVLDGSNFCSFCGNDLRNTFNLKQEKELSENVNFVEAIPLNEEKEITPGFTNNESISDNSVSDLQEVSDANQNNDTLNFKERDISIQSKDMEFIEGSDNSYLSHTSSESEVSTEPGVSTEPTESTEPRVGNYYSESKKTKVFMGEYDNSEMKHDEEPVLVNDTDNDEPILDRDLIMKEQEKHNISDKFRKPILIIVLLAMAVAAFYGIKFVNESKIKREEQLRIQEELRKAEELRKQIEGYLTLTDGYIIASEKQMSNFEKNLEQLSKIETANWFKKLNFGKLFNSVVDTLMGMDSYTQMSGVSKEIGDKLNDLNNPPDKMRDIYVEAQKVSAEEKAITAAFTDDLKKKTYDELKSMIDSLSDSIYTLKETADNFR